MTKVAKVWYHCEKHMKYKAGCSRCQRKANDWGREYRRTHREQCQVTRRLYVQRLRLDIIKLLGGKCVVCGTTDTRILCINHLNGNGGPEARSHFQFYMNILSGRRAHDDLDIRCYNDNILYEYEVGRRSEDKRNFQKAHA